MLFVYLFMIVLLIRPQDWIPFFLNWPTHYILIPPGIACGLVSNRELAAYCNTPQTKLLLGYLLIIIVSAFVNTSFSAAFSISIEWFKHITVFFLVLLNVNSEKRLENVIRFLVFLIFLLGIHALEQGLTGHGWGGLTPFPGYDVLRVRYWGDWDGPNVFAILLIMGFVLSFNYVLGSTKNWQRLMYAFALPVLGTAIFYTNSRGGLLGLIAGCLTLLFLRYHKKKLLGLIVCGLFIFALISLAPGRMGDISSSESSAHERVYLWEQGLRMLRENPLLGIGKDQFTRHSYSNLKAHNNFVTVFAETGLAGFYCWMGVVYLCLYGLGSAFTECDKLDYKREKLYLTGLISTFIAYLSSTFFVVMENDLLFFIFGLYSVAYIILSRRLGKEPKMRLVASDYIGIALSFFCVICLVWLAAVTRIV